MACQSGYAYQTGRARLVEFCTDDAGYLVLHSLVNNPCHLDGRIHGWRFSLVRREYKREQASDLDFMPRGK